MTDPLETVLNRLDRWRHLPKYRLEQHVDVLFGLTLPTVIRGVFGTEGELHVIPEFPVRHGTVGNGEGNQSFNIDFAVFAQDDSRVFLVELKTDEDSIDPKQLCNMRRVPGRFDAVVGDIPCIANATKKKPKYLHLISELHRAGAMCIDKRRFKGLNPTRRLHGFGLALESCCVASWLKKTKPELVLVHPCRKELAAVVESETDLNTEGFYCLDFPQYAAEMNPKCPIEVILTRHLCRWRTPAGTVMPEWS